MWEFVTNWEYGYHQWCSLAGNNNEIKIRHNFLPCILLHCFKETIGPKHTYFPTKRKDGYEYDMGKSFSFQIVFSLVNYGRQIIVIYMTFWSKIWSSWEWGPAKNQNWMRASFSWGLLSLKLSLIPYCRKN